MPCAHTFEAQPKLLLRLTVAASCSLPFHPCVPYASADGECHIGGGGRRSCSCRSQARQPSRAHVCASAQPGVLRAGSQQQGALPLPTPRCERCVRVCWVQVFCCLTVHWLRPSCTCPSGAGKPCLCPVVLGPRAPSHSLLLLPVHALQVPCNPDGTPQLGLDGCFMHLPAIDSGALGMVHFGERAVLSMMVREPLAWQRCGQYSDWGWLACPR